MRTPLSEQEKKFLLQLAAVLKHDNGIPIEDVVLMVMQINTAKKLEELKKWLRSRMDGDQLRLTANELLNETSRISRM